ncbi:MAG: lysoplasmalogenase [Myxococcota bacterium]
MSLLTAGVALCAICLLLVLIAEQRGASLGVKIAKPLASTGFLLAALGAGAMDSAYGQAIFAALVLSWFGDVFLMFRGSKPCFKAGIAAFLLGHVGFIVAFIVGGVAPLWSAGAILPVIVVALLVLRWLRPHVSADMKGAVLAYVGVISIMVIAAAGTPAAGQPITRFIGACAFFCSDLAVARERFVASSYLNRLWGLPLYYAAQLTLALTI